MEFIKKKIKALLMVSASLPPWKEVKILAPMEMGSNALSNIDDAVTKRHLEFIGW